MDFINKLKSQINNKETEKFKNVKSNEEVSKNKSFDLRGGKVLKNDFGTCLVKEKFYNQDFTYGICNFKDLEYVRLENLNNIKAGSDITLNNIVFLDTETTGLSSGTGTVAFLIGIGYFKDKLFHLRQFFMRDYDEEFAVLYEVNKILNNYKYMVSYNGKAFDWNLLRTRFLLNRINIENINIIHFDLLYISRRIWRRKLINCKLSTIEKYILKVERKEDIIGELIPKVYFEFLENGYCKSVLKIMEHNEFDILSMIALLKKITELSGNPFVNAYDYHEIIGIGELYEKNLKMYDALKIYEHCSFSEDYIIKNESLKRLVGLYKHFKDDTNMEKNLKKLLDESQLPLVSSMVDLAKFYEHRRRDYYLALKIVNRAIDSVVRFKATRRMHLKDLNYRKNRLIKKIERQKNKK